MIRFLRSIGKYIPYIRYASVSELKSEVSRSYLNWLWWFLDPLFFMGIYIFIGATVFKTRAEDYPIFIMIGLTMWNMFNKSCVTCVKVVRANIKMIQQVYLPKPVLVLVKMQVNAFKVLFSFIIIVIMMIAYKVPLTLYVFNLIPIFIVTIIITFAACVWLMHLGVYVADFENIVGILLRLAFYLSGIFYSVSDQLAGSLSYWMVRLNPMAFLIIEARNALLYGQPTDYVLLLYWAVVGIILASAGVALVYKYENGYAKVVQ